jgi:hypothetical protein
MATTGRTALLESLRLRESTEKRIVLQTRKGREIRNVIDVDPDYWHIQNYQRLLKEHPGWTERKPPVGGYNCVGHVWASRRTGVFDDLEDQLKVILDDDGYRYIDIEKEKPHPGDLVTYWRPAHPRPMFLHVGMIVNMKEGPSKESPRIPWVLSKMDSTSGEVLHHFNDVKFIQGVEHITSFWTDRPL